MGEGGSSSGCYGVQFLFAIILRPSVWVQGRGQPTPRAASQELGFSELMELMKRQKEQLNQLTQAPHSQGRTPRNGPLICRRCQHPGHFAHECDGEWVASRPRANSENSNTAELPSPHLPEN